VTQDRFVQIIKDLQNYTCDRPLNLLFRFDTSVETQTHNDNMLKHFNYNLNATILAQTNSQVMFGSEFKEPHVLEELLCDHPNWKQLKSILLSGAEFPLNDISHEERSHDLEYHRNRDNHKSALRNKKILDDLIETDICHGFALPLPVDTYKYFPFASIAPLGCQEQETINAQGEKNPKFRMTHDQSFPGPSGKSVNLQVQKEKLPPCMYSFVLSRILHYIVDLCKRHPTTRIYLCKIDLDSAYRRCHLSSNTATECFTIYNDTLLLAL